MCATNGLQTTMTLDPVNSDGQAFSLDMLVEMTLPMPPQDEHLPDQIEAYVHQAGLEIQRKLFQVLIEKSDKELVLEQRHGKGGAGIQRRGTRPHTFKTTFGEVTVQRSRISHHHDGTTEVPSATAWNTSHQLTITENLRDAVCDQMSDQSAGKSRADICQSAGDDSLLGRARSSTSCMSGASNWSTRSANVPVRSWTACARPSLPCSVRPWPTLTP